MTIGNPKVGIFLSYPQTINGFFFLAHHKIRHKEDVKSSKALLSYETLSLIAYMVSCMTSTVQSGVTVLNRQTGTYAFLESSSHFSIKLKYRPFKINGLR